MKSKISILTILLALAACNTNDIMLDNSDMEFRKVIFAAPLAQVNIPLYRSIDKYLEFGENSELRVNSEGVLYIEYYYPHNIEINDHIKINDERRIWARTFENDEWIPPSSSSTFYTFSVSEEYDFDLTPSEDNTSYITDADLSRGELKIDINVPSDLANCDIDIEIPGLTKDGDFFKKTLTKNSPTVTEDLAGYTVKADANRSIKVICNITARTNTVSSGVFEINFALTDMDFYSMEGYFGQFDFSVTEMMNFDFFEELEISGELGLQGTTMKTVITNTVGLPLQIISDVALTNENDVNAVPLANMDMKVGAAKRDNNNVTPEKTEEITSLSNILLGNSNYNTLSFDITGKTNPDGTISNFLRHDNVAEVDIFFTVPFDFKLEYMRQDTVGFDYREMVSIGADVNDKDADKFSRSISNFVMYLNIDNVLPFEVDLELFAITDRQGDSPIPIDVISIRSKNQRERIRINQRLLSQFWSNDVKHIVLRTAARTKDGNYQKVTTNDYLEIAISLEFESNIPISF